MVATPSRARLGISLQFFTNGALMGTLLPHYPQIKDAFELSNAVFGLLVVAFPVGSLLTAAFAGRAIRRFGALTTATVLTVTLAVLLAVAVSSPWLWLLFAGLLLAGCADPVLDAAQNVHGLRVERALGRSVINSMHAIWSLGAVTGGLVGAWTAGLGLRVGPVMVGAGLVWSSLAVLAWWLGRLPGTEERTPATEQHARPTRAGALLLVAPVAVLAVAGTLVEEVGNSWATLYARDVTGAAPGVAGLAYVTAYAAQFVGRITGDRLTDRFGRGEVAVAGGVLIALGGLVVMVAPTVLVVLAGFVLLGLGCATLVPAAFAAAHELPGLAYGTGVALVGWLMRGGFVLTSPLLGAIADRWGLRAGMVLPLLAGVVAVVVAARLRGPRQAAASGASRAGAPATPDTSA